MELIQLHIKCIDDPSGDDFHYFRGTDFDNASTQILDRYKDYNNTDGNSSTLINLLKTILHPPLLSQIAKILIGIIH